MKYINEIKEGIFIERLNRFIALVSIDNQVISVHVRNTGRCKELLIPGTTVYLEKASKSSVERKTAWSLVAVYKENTLVNIDSNIPNSVVFEALQQKYLSDFKDISLLKREVTYLHSRFDIYYETTYGQKGFVEVKGVTLEQDGIAQFPDAPTIRGTKHIYELIKAKEDGYYASIFFLIQMKGVHCFKPNDITDINFANALHEARRKGVAIYAYDTIVTPTTISINQPIPILL